MTGQNLMIDVDEVIFPLGDTIHDIGHELGLHDGETPWMTWSAWEQYKCHPDAYWKLWDIFVERDGYRTTSPIPGAVEALRWLYWEGHTINLVTARGFMANADHVRAATPDWLEEFAVPYHTLTFSQDKAGEQERLGAYDLAIDDSPRNFAALVDAGVNTWLQDHPHNQGFDCDFRLKDLWEFAYIAEKLAV